MRWFGDPRRWPAQDLIGFSDEFDAELTLAAYREGLFPMPLYQGDFRGEMGWWSPTHRGVLPVESLRVTRSLRQSAKRYRTTVDADFAAVLRRCGDPSRPDGWIDDRIRGVYTELHRRGVAHSVEVWTAAGELAGGLYGLGFGGLFAGESMFHDPVIGRDASKVALVRLVAQLGPGRLIDTQWATEHLATLGVIEIDRAEYLELLPGLLRMPEPDWPRRDDA